MSKCAHRFRLFSNTVSLRSKGPSALMLWPGLTQVTHMKPALCSVQQQHTLVSYGLLSTLLSLSLSSLLSVTRGGFLEYIFGLLNSWYSVSQLLLALAQRAANW
ncbi:unnamed protein product [Hymenolepis diminuta]|uniref:Secreted protein n=1 Tax=Hymenolepis diminuta TaxID=6216 RepID=A0A0R3SNA5_HYMDI|nr:unnamed protein product [Hymenolepis diminuta]